MMVKWCAGSCFLRWLGFMITGYPFTVHLDGELGMGLGVCE